ncbi:exodeoxyribonuclease VII large subunit [Psychromonas sp. SP041]|uniref:exodeoxyribonuclease VII large subunit n=1 Tax=Psychromonas sp. SP041 TaxID=1365007 RepID=UPI001485A86A|nr:exodeoxyribonuclease VII large subunit [Psychromonas sp. SP041]
MYSPFILQADLELSVPIKDKQRAVNLGAKPLYNNGAFCYWYVPMGIDVVPFKEFWILHFSNWYRENISDDVITSQGVKLSKVLSHIKQAVDNAFNSSVWVEAEIIDIKHGRNTYIEIAEYDENNREIAKGRAMIFYSNSGIIAGFEKATGIKLGPNMKVLFRTTVQFHEQYGVGLVINAFEPRFTVGDMEAKTAKIINSLTQEGIIDANKNKLFPFDYNNIAVIAPENAAGLGDFRTQADLLSKHELCSFDYFTAKFQGKDSLNEMCVRLDEIAKKIYMGAQYDALVIIRGGGDKAGLYAMNEIEIARRVCRFPIPVIVGIGHDRDETVLDKLACIRRPTPSLVISGIAGDIIATTTSAKNMMNDLNRFSAHAVSNLSETLSKAAFELKTSAGVVISKADMNASLERDNLVNVALRTVTLAESSSKELALSVFYRDPVKVLSQGYAIIKDNDNKALGSTLKINKNDVVDIQMKDGILSANIINKKA